MFREREKHREGERVRETSRIAHKFTSNVFMSVGINGDDDSDGNGGGGGGVVSADSIHYRTN